MITAYNAEINALVQAGCRYLQLDETSFAKFGDPKIRESLTARGDPWEALLEQYIDVMNAVLSAAPSDMRIGMHICRGNSGGGWQASGGYDTVADKVFRKLKLNFYFLEYDSPRAGGFEPLRRMPDDKVVVLGLVSTKTGELSPTLEGTHSRSVEVYFVGSAGHQPAMWICQQPRRESPYYRTGNRQVVEWSMSLANSGTNDLEVNG